MAASRRETSAPVACELAESECVVCEICHHDESVESRIRWEDRDARRGRFPASPRCLQTACQFYLGTIDELVSDDPKSQGKETLRYELD